MINVCFVCLGNICRSPTAEGVMKHLVAQAGLQGSIQVDSAGTSAYHVGEPPERRAVASASRRGIDISGRSRQFVREDFQRFDYVLAMDGSNQKDLLALAPNDEAEAKVSLLRSFDPASSPDAGVPDPYYGGADGFELVLDLCLAACQGLLGRVREEYSI